MCRRHHIPRLVRRQTFTQTTVVGSCSLCMHQSEYSLMLKKGETETASGKWCELVGCKAESEFISNNAGWAIYERVVA